MSTNNNASQTLFRFVSLRNPQLTETKEINLGFIHRPNLNNAFDQAVRNRSGISKLQALKNQCRLFSSPLTEQDLENSQYLTLLKIGRKISRQETLSDEELAKTKDQYSSGQVEIEKLWDNLIYQVATQKDFYAKEAIVHILKAFHVGYAQTLNLSDAEITKANGVKPLERALDGKIVLPKSLFAEDNVAAGSVSSRMAAEGSVALSTRTNQRLEAEGKTLLALNTAIYQKEALEKLTAELEKLQKKYYKSSYQTYQEEYKKYQEENREALEAYEKKLTEIESKITEETPEEEKVRLYEELKRYEVAPFEFSYKNEINLWDLKEKLSPESFDTFIKLFAEFDHKKASEEAVVEKGVVILSDNTLTIGSQTITLDDELHSYDYALNIIRNTISASVQAALENSPLSQQQYVNIGGASVPVVNTTARTPMAYSFFAHNTFGFLGTGGFVNFSFEVADSSWSVASAKITASTDTGSFEESFSNIPVISDKITLPTCLVNKFRASLAFRIDLIFENGSSAYADLGQLYPKEDISLTGMLTLTRGVAENPEEPETVTIQKRKNFGIKRLGVADYLKVVQSVHAYVPGEVSNIENVMASELRHKSSVARDYSEIIDTTSKSQETEKISDTTKTSRTDMQTEVAKELDKQQSITAYAHFSYNPGYKLDIGADYANNTAQHDSTRQAVMKSQEITERAMERVLTKISEERVQKIIKEYTETNVHEFDNRGKVTKTDDPEAAHPKHITGVYRWIDMKYKNQIYNYGIRTMFEFMVPEPSRLHRLAVAVSKAQVLTAPIDPRTAPERAWTMPDPKSATKEQLQYWANVYGVKLTDIKEKDQHIENIHDEFGQAGNCIVVQRNLTVPANYVCKSVDVSFTATKEKGSRGIEVTGDFTNGIGFHKYTASEVFSLGGFNLSGNWVFKNSGYNIHTVDISLKMNLEILPSLFEAWKQENFDAIIKAYEEAYKKFQEEQAKLDEEQKAKEAEAKERQGNFYRYMEHDTLKHNCIAYLLQDYLTTLGQETTNALNDNTRMDNFQVYLNENLDQYAALAKFMEQAFEWEIMDYTFYPYYWANRKSWQEFYLTESMDPLFRSFLQAGMARIIVTVKPGFEAAVQFFLETGLIWNGGEVPVIGDPMYMSIVDEMRQPTGVPQGKYWITRVPTTLTILQASSTGLPVNQPLPIFPEDDPKNCENPKELEFETSFSLDTDAQLVHSDGATTLPSTIIKPV